MGITCTDLFYINQKNSTDHLNRSVITYGYFSQSKNQKFCTVGYLHPDHHWSTHYQTSYRHGLHKNLALAYTLDGKAV